MTRLALLLLSGGLIFHAQATLEYSVESPGAQEIDAYLAKKQSPMAGMGPNFSSYGAQWGVDPRLIVAIAGAETTFGKHLCAEHNAWNWFHHKNCPQSPFEDYPHGAERVTKFMRLSYLNRGYTTIELIRYKYCASGCDNWIPLVSSFYAEMPASLQSVPVSSGPGTVSPSAPLTPSNSITSTGQSSSGNRIFGIPVYWVFFGLAGAVIVWSMSAFRR